ncbi:MAG: sulfatase-like hydrolase/transferase [Planctomycetaceae bacterium]
MSSFRAVFEKSCRVLARGGDGSGALELLPQPRVSVIRCKRRHAVMFGTWIALLLVSPRLVAAQPPNIVLIMADDLGYGDVGCYGSELNETPHIDALAAGGLRFTDFHSAGPMCSPTRAAVLTGQYQQRFGHLFDTAISGTDHRDRGLPHDAMTIAELLRQQGYATACFGKWHLGYVPPWLPPNQGFDLFRGLGSGDGDFHTHVDRSGNEDWWYNNQLRKEKGYTTDLLTGYSVEFIEQHREQPFFLYLPHLGIHFPWQGPHDPPHRQAGRSYHDDKWGIIPNPGDVSPHVKAMVESVDDSVGQVVAALKKWQLDKNTLVIFTSDNGGYLTYGENFRNISSNGVLRGQKTELYEGGHRVPAIVSWPGKIESSVTNETGHSTDLMPTFTALAGIATADVETDGVDLGQLLFDGKSLPKRTLFWRARSERAVRDGAWKLCFNETQAELFNLDDDIGEQHDLAREQHDRVIAMKEAWANWESDVNRSASRFEN